MSYLENASRLQKKMSNADEDLGILIYTIEATNNFLKFIKASLPIGDQIIFNYH